MSALLLLCFPERLCAADSFAEAARGLAGKILASVGSLENAASLLSVPSFPGSRRLPRRRQAIEKELRTQGIRFASDAQATVRIRVTLSENLQQLIWIAEIRPRPEHRSVQ